MLLGLHPDGSKKGMTKKRTDSPNSSAALGSGPAPAEALTFLVGPKGQLPTQPAQSQPAPAGSLVVGTGPGLLGHALS